MKLDEMFVEWEPHAAGLSDDQLVLRWLELDEQIKQLAYERKVIASTLIEKATNERSGQNTVKMRASNGAQLTIEFKKAWRCDSEELEVAKEILQDEAFGALFRVEYSPKVRALRSFLNTMFADERIETAKAIIKEFCVEVDGAPYVSAPKTEFRR